MQNYTESNNLITISGRISQPPVFSHSIYDENFYNLTLKSLRTSGIEDEVPVSISDRLVLNIAEVEEGTWLKVMGQIRTFNERTENNQKPKLKVYVFAQDVLSEDDLECSEQDCNEVCLKGYICKVPNYRETPAGRSICDITMAVNRKYGKSDYIPSIVWGRNANFVSNLKVGTCVEAYGRLQSRIYSKKISEEDSIQRVAYEFSIARISVVEEFNNGN